MPSLQIAEALRGLCTGDQDPPRPWAHMSHVGVRAVGELAYMESTFTDQAGFEITLQDGSKYRVMVQRFDTRTWQEALEDAAETEALRREEERAYGDR